MAPGPTPPSFRALLQRLPWEALIAASVAIDLISTDLGSSSLPTLARDVRVWRWVALALFALTAALGAAARGRGARMPHAPAVAGLLFLALAFLSTAWSIDPRLTAGRAASLLVLLAGVWATARICARSPQGAERVVVALAGAATALALGGFVAAVAARGTGFYFATSPPRFRGLGENPDTAPLVEALALVLLVFLATRWTGRRRLAAVAGIASVAASILLSQSRASLLGGMIGLLVLVGSSRATLSRRAACGLAMVAVAGGGWFAAGAIVAQVAPTAVSTRASASAVSSRSNATGSGCSRPTDGLKVSSSELTKLVPRSGSLLTGSGRTLAWKAAFHLGNRRPLGGYGFGTEELAFGPVACTLAPAFESPYVENSYLGTYVQLGLAGVLAAAALLAALVAAGLTAVRGAGPERPFAVALFAVVLTGLVEAVFQSYLWSVGDVGALTFWTCAALLVAFAARSAREPDAR